MKKKVNITRDVESRRRIARGGASRRAAQPAEKYEKEAAAQEQLSVPEGAEVVPVRSKRPRGTTEGKP